MKRCWCILYLLLALFVACNKPQPEPVVAELEPLPFEIDENLQNIDTLLQHDAATALQELLSSDTLPVIFNENYHQLLLSEALYKTDNPQYYRNELQAAMRFFDSLAVLYSTNDDLTVLSARSHYMNGVGFYENDSIVEACKEYLHTLEIMENHFNVETLRGYRAKFMGLTYNRLKELFTSQFMVEPAIYCGKKSLYYCKIAPTSKYGVSNNLAKLGKLYDISDQADSAYYYYNEGLKALPDTNNLIYRDLVSSLPLLSYKLGYGLQPSLDKLFFVAKSANSYDELLTRYFTIGGLYYEENMYDSAVKYLYRVFEYEGDYMRRQQAADFLMNIYQKSNDTIKLSKYSIFLAQNTISKYDESLNESVLSELFHNYLSKKQTELQKRNRIKTIIAISLFVILVLSSMMFLIAHSSKKINKLNKEHTRTINTERKARYREKDKMLDTIKQQETKVNALEEELGYKRCESNKHMEEFLKEPVCCKIQNSVGFISITSRVCPADYLYLKLDEATIVDLDKAVSNHFPNFKQRLSSIYPQLKQSDILLCYLYLLKLKDQQITVLMQYSYSTVFRKTKKLEQSFNIGVTLSEFLQTTAVL